MFGAGIRRDLSETYRRIKERGELIESLDEPGGAAPARRPARVRRARPDVRPILDGIVQAADQLRDAEAPLQSRAYSLLRAAAALADAAAREPGDLDEFGERLRRVRSAYTQVANTYNRRLYSD